MQLDREIETARPAFGDERGEPLDVVRLLDEPRRAGECDEVVDVIGEALGERLRPRQPD